MEGREDVGDAMKKLLLVDDDRVILNLLAEGLRDLGYATSIAASGAEALQLAAQQEYDLVVLDMRMPDMSGLDVARQLQAAGRFCFVFLSAFGDESIVRDAAEVGALGYLVKPVDIPQLIPFIEAAMARGKEIGRLRITAEQLDQALRVEQKTRTAVGIIMARKGLDRQAAFDLLRTSARSRRRKIGELAEAVISAEEDLNEALRALPNDDWEYAK